MTDGVVEVIKGLHSPQVTATISGQDFIDLNVGKLDGMAAFTSGRLKIDGDMGLMSKSAKFFKKLEPSSFAGPLTVFHSFQKKKKREASLHIPREIMHRQLLWSEKCSIFKQP